MTGTKGIGGFFPLELPTVKGALPPPEATLLNSGRACLRAILEHVRPARFFAPYYICDSALAPAQALGIPIEFYPIDRTLSPLLPELNDRDVVLVVDYFGLCGDAMSKVSALSDRAIVDQTQALFATYPMNTWRFTSARKWFGVPDGAFLWGPRSISNLPAAPLTSLPEHLVERLWGDQERAYRAYQAAEARFDTVTRSISTTSVALLNGVDVALVSHARRQNFLRLESRLSGYNDLRLSLPAGDVPFCYPMLPRVGVSREDLARTEIFVPQFWFDCVRRAQATFAWELDLSRRLLPLPVDHRYGSVEMDRVADQIIRLIEERTA